jgi:hypothetical protein
MVVNTKAVRKLTIERSEAKDKKPPKKQIDKELTIAVSDYQQLREALHKQCLWNLAGRLKMAPEELEEDWFSLT